MTVSQFIFDLYQAFFWPLAFILGPLGPFGAMVLLGACYALCFYCFRKSFGKASLGKRILLLLAYAILTLSVLWLCGLIGSLIWISQIG